jgi:N-acetylglutamate synthase-like GNAT family acetyltransferase
MQIRKANTDDALQIVEFKKRSIPICAKGFYSEEIIDHWANHNNIESLINSIKKGRIRFVAEENGCVIGEASLNAEQDTLKTLYVDINEQGKGIGKKLLLKCEKTLKEKDNKKIVIHAALCSENFYAKQGYKKIKNITLDFFGMQMENVLMEKEL